MVCKTYAKFHLNQLNSIGDVFRIGFIYGHLEKGHNSHETGSADIIKNV